MSGKLDALLEVEHAAGIDWDQVFRTFKRLRGVQHMTMYLCQIIPIPECPFATVDALLTHISSTETPQRTCLTGPHLAQLISLIWTAIWTGEPLHKGYYPHARSFLDEFPLLPEWKRVMQQAYQQYHDQYEDYRKETKNNNGSAGPPTPANLIIPNLDQVVQALRKTARIVRAMPRSMVAPILPPQHRPVKIAERLLGNTVKYTDDPTMPLLHFLTWNNVPPCLLFLTALIFPDQVRQRDAWGNLPIHYATLSTAEWNTWWRGQSPASSLLDKGGEDGPWSHYQAVYYNQGDKLASPQVDFSDLLVLQTPLPPCPDSEPEENKEDKKYDDEDDDDDEVSMNGVKPSAAAGGAGAGAGVATTRRNPPPSPSFGTAGARRKLPPTPYTALASLVADRNKKKKSSTSSSSSISASSTTTTEFPQGPSLVHVLQHETAIPLLTILYPRGASKKCTVGRRLPIQSYLLSLLDYRRQHWNKGRMNSYSLFQISNNHQTTSTISTISTTRPPIWMFVQEDIQRLLELCPQGIVSVDPQLGCPAVAFPAMALGARMASSLEDEEEKEQEEANTSSSTTTNGAAAAAATAGGGAAAGGGARGALQQSRARPGQAPPAPPPVEERPYENNNNNVNRDDQGFLPEDDEYQDEYDVDEGRQQHDYMTPTDYESRHFLFFGHYPNGRRVPTKMDKATLTSNVRDPVFDLAVLSLTYQLLRSRPRAVERGRINREDDDNDDDDDDDSAIWNLRERHLHRRWKIKLSEVETMQSENRQLEATLAKLLEEKETKLEAAAAAAAAAEKHQTKDTNNLEQANEASREEPDGDEGGGIIPPPMTTITCPSKNKRGRKSNKALKGPPSAPALPAKSPSSRGRRSKRMRQQQQQSSEEPQSTSSTATKRAKKTAGVALKRKPLPNEAD